MLLYYSRTLWSRRHQHVSTLVALFVLTPAAAAPAQPYADTSRSALPQYAITARLDPDAGVVRASAIITWSNTSADTLHGLCLRLDDPALSIASLRQTKPVDRDLTSTARIESVGTLQSQRVMVVASGLSVLPGQENQLTVTWTTRPDSMGARSAAGAQALLLAGWVPRVVADCTPDHPQTVARRPGFADFRATLAVPEGWQVAAAGRPAEVGTLADGMRQHSAELAAATDFAWVALNAAGMRRDRVTLEGAPSVDLSFWLTPQATAQADRIVETTKRAIRRFTEWYGPYPDAALTIVEAPWNSGLAGAAYPGLVLITSRWLAPERDLSLERALIGAVGRQYWLGATARDPRDGWFEEGAVLYSGARAINDELEGRHYDTRRYFGGFIPYTIRSILLSRAPGDPRPPVGRFGELDAPTSAPWRAWTTRAEGEAQQTALALRTLERHVGWPTLQQTIATFLARFRGRHPVPADFSALASEQHGTDLMWFFSEAFRFPARFDYGIERFSSERVRADAATFETILHLRRVGDGVFAGTSHARVEGVSAAQSLPVTIAFEDGTEVHDWWDGRVPNVELAYESTSRAVRATVDPDLVLLLDSDRRNNTRTQQPRLPALGVRLALNWVIWLQDLVLTYTSLV